MGVGQDFSGGDWWWGHPFGKRDPPDISSAVEISTALLPTYHRDILRLKLCPSFLDHQAKKSPEARCPFLGAQFHLAHEDVAKMLAECPHQHLKGQIERKNELGYLELTSAAFKRNGTLGLGLPVDKHRVVRKYSAPLIAQIPGFGGMMQEMHNFLDGRQKVALPGDIDVWWCQLLWRYCVKREISVKEAEEFISFRQNWLVAAVAHVDGFSVAHLTFSMDDVNKEQDKYRGIISAHLPGTIPKEVKDDVAQAVLEMISFAGGLSVPQTIHAAIAALFQDFMPEPVTKDNVLPFVYEVTRLFPAVQGFGLWKDGERHVLYLNGALRDPKVWGENADRFTLKDVKLYQEKHVGFANQAVAPDDADSKVCPGIQVALDATQAAVLAFGTWAKPGKRIDSIWRPEGKIEVAGKPSWWQPFVLERIPNKERNAVEVLVDRNHSGEAALADLSPTEISSLLSKVDADRDQVPDMIRKVDAGTWLFYVGATQTWEDMSQIKDIDLPRAAPIGAYNDDNSVELAMGAIRLPYEDEQWSGMGFLKKVGLDLVRFVNWTQDDQIADSLYVRTSEERLAAIAACQQAFIRGEGGKSYLPPCKAPVDDWTSDKAQGIMARFAGGQLFLKSNKDAAREGLGELVCDITALSKYEVRHAFEHLGAKAYFKVEANGDFGITAIEWNQGQKLVSPGDAEWEHCKFVWRCSIVTYATAVHHLTWCHWIQANAFSTSLREALRPDHPIRRVMHVHQYNTAFVNMTSYSTLYAEHGFLHRLCPFQYKSLQHIFHDAADAFTYKTLPQQYEESDLPEEVKAKLPMFEDGLPLWRCMRDFYSKYVDIFYPTEDILLNDPEIKAYWEFKSCPPYTRGLPTLSKSSFIDQLTQACFDVTAYHEFVGSAVPYLTDPAGAFMQVRPGCDMADLQHMMQTLSLASTTGSPMPLLLDDWSHLLKLPNKETTDKSLELWEAYRKSLLTFAEEVEQRNAKRSHAFPHYNPKNLECSVNL